MFKDRYNFQNNQPLINFMIYDFRSYRLSDL